MTVARKFRWTDWLAIFVLGIIGIALVTAVLTSAVSSSNTKDRTDTLATQLKDANEQLDELKTNATVTAQRSTQAASERQALLAQNRALQRQIRALVKYLRDHDIEVPAAALAPPSTSSGENRPKAPHGHPENPGPHPATPSTGAIDLCALIAPVTPCPFTSFLLLGGLS